MSTTDSGFADYCCELLASLGPCHAKAHVWWLEHQLRWLDGGCDCRSGQWRHVVAQSQYADNRATFEAEGCKRFIYTAKGVATWHELLQRPGRRHGVTGLDAGLGTARLASGACSPETSIDQGQEKIGAGPPQAGLAASGGSDPHSGGAWGRLYTGQTTPWSLRMASQRHVVGFRLKIIHKTSC